MPKNRESTAFMIIGALLAGVGLMARPAKVDTRALRRLRIKRLDPRREELTYLVEFRNWPGEPDTVREFTVPVQNGRLFEDFDNHHIIVTGDTNTSQIAVDLYGEDGYSSVYRIHIDFVRGLTKEGPQ